MAGRIEMPDLTDKNRLVQDELIPVYRIDDRTVAKLTHPNRIAEAEALRFVRANTPYTIPAPEVYEAYPDTETNHRVILMEYIDELRSIKGAIGSVDGTCEDPVFCAELGGFGPYKNEVVAILDWEMAGFYPEYWEYVKAMYHPDSQSGWIKDAAVEKILQPYHLEHAVLLHMQDIVYAMD
ncbi:hypothetical protein AJ78_07708 [Emergomyces pasteurianus Ep9510]|uniref:Aminoglycoside phosphotransferase domain-containing protein n=1 Tax=Emergomyces pasteurianus Ep9510 TaxID=1447872 RepID=A0A1J9Q6J3_9EURO|nr:hypothetical protein AJ78_07708 [Emergomyces pasteurianus Ep9510]